MIMSVSNRSNGAFDRLEGSVSRRRSDDEIVKTAQYLRQIRAHIDVISHNQNSFVSLGADVRLIRFVDFVGVFSLQAWQVDFDGRTVPLYVATRLLDESVHLSAKTAGVSEATIMSTLRRTRSAANSGSWLRFP